MLQWLQKRLKIKISKLFYSFCGGWLMKTTKICRVNILIQCIDYKVPKLPGIFSHRLLKSDLRTDLQRHLDIGRGSHERSIHQITLNSHWSPIHILGNYTTIKTWSSDILEQRVCIEYSETCKGFKNLSSNGSYWHLDSKWLSHLVKMEQASKLLICIWKGHSFWKWVNVSLTGHCSLNNIRFQNHKDSNLTLKICLNIKFYAYMYSSEWVLTT